MKAVIRNYRWLPGAFAALLAAATISAAEKTAKTSAAASTPKPLVDTLEFKNGDRLRGTFSSYDSGGVHWKHHAIEPLLAVKPAEISVIRVERSRPSKGTAYNCVALLAGGDELAGNLIGLDSQKLRLETWYGGTLEIARAGLRSLWLGFRQDEIVYQGPTSLQGWNVSKGMEGVFRHLNIMAAGGALDMAEVLEEAKKKDAETPSWEYKDGAFVSNGRGTLGRDLKLPEDCMIEFDLECQGYPQLGIYLYADATDKTSGINSYYLNLSARRAYLNRMTGTSSRSVGSTEIPLLDGTQSKLRVGLRASLEQKALVLYLNESLAHKWPDIGELPKRGSALIFNYMGASPLKISNLRVSKATGPLEDLTGAAAAISVKEDLVMLNNKDKISGQVQAIKDGQVAFLLQSNPITIPVERVRWIHLAQAEKADAKPPASAVRLNFALRGSVTMTMEKWEGDQVTGRSPHLGEVKFATSAFKSIQFDPAPARPSATPVSSATGSSTLFQQPVIRR